jgi:hypothetical protein
MSKEDLNYVVKLVRKDGNTVDLVETKEFSVAKSVWGKSHAQWAAAVEERRPYLIEEPCDNGFITAFDPSLIQEILILPVELQEQTDNPYKRRMQKEGFGGMFPGQGGSDLQDGGYK